MAQSKHWCFTCNNPSSSLKLLFDAETVAYAVWQYEKGESGTPHFQGYLQAHKVIRLTGVRKILEKAGYANAHVEVKKGSVEQAVSYCKKDEGRISGPFEFGELPARKPAPVGQGERTDLIKLREAVKSKRKFVDIADDDDLLPVLAKHHKFEAKLREAYQQRDSQEFRKVNVEVLWGTTGTGKTRKAVEAGAFKWSPSDPEWFNGYQGEDVLLIDEFYGQIKPGRLLELLDGYSCRLPTKGGFVYAAWTKVFITSNTDPDSWYNDIPPAVKAALQRRITTVTEMGGNSLGAFDFAHNRDTNGGWGKF